MSDGQERPARDGDASDLTPGISYLVSKPPANGALNALMESAWGRPGDADWTPVLARSLCHVCAHAGPRLVGFVNVAWDGGIHASVFDTAVHADFRRRGIATEMLRRAAAEARRRGAEWLHVDFEPHLEGLYRRAGFGDTKAGLIRLAD